MQNETTREKKLIPGSFEWIRAENKKLMIEASGLDFNTAEGALRKMAIAQELHRNNQDLQAMAAAFGPDSEAPRIMAFKNQQIRSYGHK